MMLKNYVLFDFGESYFRNRRVVDLVLEKMPVSISLGLWTTLLDLSDLDPARHHEGGARRLALRRGELDRRCDRQRHPGLPVRRAAAGAVRRRQLRAVVPAARPDSDNWETLSWPARIGDYFWHLVLPITAMVIGGFATLTMLTKNSFLDQINQQYVLTARAKGLSERRVLWGHVFRNAMLIVIAGFPAAFVGILFTGTVFIEIIFSLDGLGLLGFEAAFQRDYPLMFGTLWFFSLVGLVLNLVGDLMYTIVDPRIDFESRRA